MKFSILIPAYKADYLQEALESCLEQQFRDFEIVILDDCSPAPIREIIKKFTDKRIRYYRNETNTGAERLVDTWNKCLRLARGEYVMCMGDDDRLKPNCLMEYAKLVNKYPEFDVYHAQTEIINEKSEVTTVLEFRPEKESVYSLMYHRWKGRLQFVGDFLYKSKSLKEKGGFYYLPMAWGSDDITAYIMALDKGIINSQIPMFQYRMSSLTLTKSGNAAIKLDAIKQDEIWAKKFLETIPKSEKDYYYWESLKEMIECNYKNKRCAALFSDICKGGIERVFFWLNHKNVYKVTLSQILSMYCSSLIMKVKDFVRRHINL